MSVERHVYPDPLAAAVACARHALALLEQAMLAADRATFAVSGGSTPRLMFQEMARTRFPWERVHLFWVDERAVPPSDVDSNYRLAQESLLGPANIPPHNVHRIQAELPPAIAAERYAAELQIFFGLAPGEMPSFDVIHRGIGPDAHTASLFPGQPLIDDRRELAAAVYADKKSQWRITMLPGVLLSARHTVMLVTGADKTEAVRCVFHEPYDVRKYPAQIGRDTAGDIAWFLDEAAAKEME